MKYFLAIMIIGAMVLSACGQVEPASFAEQRKKMIQEQIVERGVTDQRILQVMDKVERHLFIPASMLGYAYDDSPLPIGDGQTISQPYIVAFMTEAAQLKENDRVLEIGTGSGYQAAILAEIVKEVYTIEILGSLANQAQQRLKDLGYKNIFVKHGDGYKGWPEYAPFDAIIATAAPDEVPQELVKQLNTGGRMVVPVGTNYQELLRITKTDQGLQEEHLLPVKFVPMIKGKE